MNGLPHLTWDGGALLLPRLQLATSAGRRSLPVARSAGPAASHAGGHPRQLVGDAQPTEGSDVRASLLGVLLAATLATQSEVGAAPDVLAIQLISA